VHTGAAPQNAPNSMDVDGSASMEAESKIAVPIAPSSVIVKGDANKKWLHLSGHSGEVFLCSWNPVEKQLASGSADGVCRLWNFVGVDKNKWESVDSQINIRSAILSHTVYSGQRFKDVTSLSWSPDGKTLVTGCYDGSVRFWDNQGALKHLSNEHSGPIFSLRWSKSGNYLLSGSHDRKALVWNPSTYAVIKTFTNHSLPVFDVDWLDDDLFATGSADKSIVISSVSTSDCKALYTFTGHESEINVVRFSPDGMMLASCSDDHTAKIWTMQNGMVQDLRGHTKEIYTCKWAMHGGKPLLCTASFDGTVKVWDAAHGKELHTISRHNQAVYSLAPSPNGQLLAVGSLGGYVSVWKLSDGTLSSEFRGTGDTFDVSWSADGTLLSSAYSSGSVRLTDGTP
jgi:transducin (beta)-like 1